MAIYFRSTPITEPFLFDSLGNHWLQEPTSRPNGFPHYHYLQTEEGSGIVQVQGNSYRLEPQEGILIAPFVEHSYCSASPGWITLFATFTGTLESSIPAIVGNQPVILVNSVHGAALSHQITAAIQKYRDSSTDTRELSLDCYRILLSLADQGRTASLSDDPLYQKYVLPIIKVIETDYALDVTADALCRLVYITPQYLSRLFVRYLGCSVYEYLTTYRISKAKEFLLTYRRMRIQEVAHRVGYTDTSHFISMFRKATGMTPTAFRKIN
ncbi:MAG: AraC family transcriptional regulator [Fusicatenibacter sp.]